MTKWEYMLIDSKKLPEVEKGIFKQSKVTMEEAENYLNKLGEEGWEIIDLDFDFLIHDTGAFVGVAKRPKV
ncbi:MAG: hypothetical protein HQ510_07275 [Candidatus Marinimicrobia bacterium]|nr:hypothetical protein [Candidatus Neomarinimicrobiota bacterium]